MSPGPAPEPTAVAGSSELELAIGRALASSVAGGTTAPLAPQSLGGAPVKSVRTNQYLLDFEAPQGQQLMLRRIYLSLPVLIEEKELEEAETDNHTTMGYESEKAAQEAYDTFIGGPDVATRDETQYSYDAPHTIVKTTVEYERQGLEVLRVESVKTSRSILPITLTLQAMLFGPAGVLWAQGFEVPTHTISIPSSGGAIGVGRLAAYADLTNPIPLRPDQEVYGLGLEVFVPTKATTTVSAGQELAEARAGEPGDGTATLFYDIENADLGK